MFNWSRYPALFYGIAIISGVALLYQYWIFLLIGFTGRSFTRILGFFLVALTSLIYATSIGKPGALEKKIEGIGYLQIDRVQRNLQGEQISGKLKLFKGEEKSYFDLPVLINDHRQKADSDYIVVGKVMPIGHGFHVMKVKEWEKVPNTFSFAEKRFSLKNKMRKYLKKHIKKRECYAFFASLGTGEIENQHIAAQFNRVGLRHTLAISGFHYTWLLFILGFCFNLLFSKRVTALILLFITTLYFLFIGETPSLNRAWMAAIVYLFGYIISQRSIGLNALGIALIFSLILDPFSIFHIGFQLSYSATFAILTLYSYTERSLQVLLLKRTFDQVRHLSYFEQHVYILTSLIRQALAVTLSVNFFTLPIILYHFHYFPLASLIFNLFFPFIMSLAMVLLIFGMALPIFLKMASWYMSFWLDLVFYGLGKLEVLVLYGSIDFRVLLSGMGLLFCIALWCEERVHQNRIDQYRV